LCGREGGGAARPAWRPFKQAITNPNLHPLSCLTRAQAKKKKLNDLPVPAIGVVADYAEFTPGGYRPPNHFIRRTLQRDAASDDTAPAEYDLEYEDEVRAARWRTHGTGGGGGEHTECGDW
jgi:hypothetical protein